MYFKKSLVATLSLALLIGSVVPVLADTTTPTQTPPAGTSTQTPQDRAQQNKARLQKEILAIQDAEQYQKYLGPIRDLQKQEAGIRDQVKATRDKIHQQIKADRQAKQYDPILTALNGLISAQDDIANLETIAQTCRADWQQLKTDRQAKNVDAITADLHKIQADIQSRIGALQKVLADLQKISQDLNASSSAPAAPQAAPSAVAPQQ